MSFIPFVDQNVAADTMSNIVIYKKQVTVATSVADYPLFTTDAAMGRFCATQVFFHVDANGGSNLLQFTAAIGFSAPAYNDICPSATRGTTSNLSSAWSAQLRLYKRQIFPVQTDTTYYSQATPNNTATQVFMRVSVAPSAALTGTLFISGYYTGMRV